MKRTTVMLPDETLARLRQEARKRSSSVAEVVRTAVETHLNESEPVRRHLAFFGIAEGLPPDAGTNHDKYLAEIYEERQRRRREDSARRWGEPDAGR